MSLLQWDSFPVIVLGVWLLVEALPLLRPALRASPWHRITAWSLRPFAVWAVANMIVRVMRQWGFHNRAAYPFYFDREKNDGWMATLEPLSRDPEFWRWSAIVLLLGILLLLLCRWISSHAMTGWRTSLALVYLLLLGFSIPVAYDALPHGVVDPMENEGSFLKMWFDPGNTMLYCMPAVGTKRHYLRHFEEIQPKLKVSIHGASHPPGASLALFWAGKALGATGSIRDDRLRYAMAHTLFSALVVFAMFALGRALCGSNAVGLLSAALWVVKPATIAYNTFAPDTIYVVFDILFLAVAWHVATATARPWFSMVALGLLLYILSMLNYNWPIFAGVFGLFLLIQSDRGKWGPAEWLLRGGIPAVLMLGMLLYTCQRYGINYFSIFLYSLDYTTGFYHMRGAGRWIMSFLGSPMDLLLLMGGACAYIFATRLPGWIRIRPLPPQVLYLLVILGAYLAAIVCFNVLKMESSRVWAWVTAVPLVLVAHALHTGEHPRFYATAAAAISMIQYYGMRLFLVSAG